MTAYSLTSGCGTPFMCNLASEFEHHFRTRPSSIILFLLFFSSLTLFRLTTYQIPILNSCLIRIIIFFSLAVSYISHFFQHWAVVRCRRVISDGWTLTPPLSPSLRLLYSQCHLIFAALFTPSWRVGNFWYSCRRNAVPSTDTYLLCLHNALWAL